MKRFDHRRLQCILIILTAYPLLPSAFAPDNGFARPFDKKTHRLHLATKSSFGPMRRHPHSTSSSSLQVSAVAGSYGASLSRAANAVVSLTRRNSNILLLILAAFATFLLSKLRSSTSNPLQSLLWPGTGISSDSQQEAPLPPGSYGCPFFGSDIFGGSKDYGPFAGLHKLCKKMTGNDLIKMYTFGMPIISVSGTKNVKSLLKHEFSPEDGTGINNYLMGEQNMGRVFGKNGILYESNAEKHALLRRLVGSALTPAAIGAAIPSIQEAASIQIDKLLNEGENGTIEMERVFSDFTLDIAWKQILGLDLADDEVPKFHQAVEHWTGGVMSPILLLPFHVPGLMKFTKVGRAWTYLVSKVEERLEWLEKNGPDNSTLGKLYFATDDDGETKLTRAQVIDNALLLIFAGSETSATTLTCASLFLALNPNVWKRIKDEQKEICSEYGEELTPQVLEKCVYLESAIKETLRLKPVESGELRKVEETIVINGKQIPKKWFAFFNIKETHWNDPKVYKEDDSHMDIRRGFKPERWLDESTKPSAWMPFGDGRHRCIGERLAMTEMKIFLSMLARRVDYELANEENDGDVAWKKYTVMARPLDGVEVRAYAAAA